MHSSVVPPARPPRRESVGVIDRYNQEELPRLPPGAAPPARSYEDQPFGYGSDPLGSEVMDRGNGVDVDNEDEERMNFRSFASPLSGLPPLLAPQPSGGMSKDPNRLKKPMPANIQTNFPNDHPPSSFTHGQDGRHQMNIISPNSAPPTHSTFAIDLTNAPPLPPKVQYQSPPLISPTKNPLRQSSRKGAVSPVSPVKYPGVVQTSNPLLGPGEPVMVYSRQPSGTSPPSAFHHQQQVKRNPSPARTNQDLGLNIGQPPRSSSMQESARSVSSPVNPTGSRSNSYNSGITTASIQGGPSVHVIASSHSNNVAAGGSERSSVSPAPPSAGAGSRSTSASGAGSRANSSSNNKELPMLKLNTMIPANSVGPAPMRSNSPLHPNGTITSPTMGRTSPTTLENLPKRRTSLDPSRGRGPSPGSERPPPQHLAPQMVSQLELQLRQPRPLPSVIQGQALNSFSLGSSQGSVPTQQDVGSISRDSPASLTAPVTSSERSKSPTLLVENIHLRNAGSPSPSLLPGDLNRDDSVMNRPKPKPKSSAYRSSPSRSPAMPSDGPTPPAYSETGSRNVSYGLSRPRSGLEALMMEEGIQAALLPHLPIASFLALMSSLEKGTRQSVSGEVVGRWVTRGWGMSLSHGDVQQWPGLGVWEGFLESMLHNAETFSTYPTHFQPLLQHLCLSYSLIVLMLRTLPVDAFPSTAPFPFEDEASLASAGMPKSVSSLSLASAAHLKKGGLGSSWELSNNSRPKHTPRAERPVELVMPEPLGAPKNDSDAIETIASQSPIPNMGHTRRRSSIGAASIISWTSKARRGSAPTESVPSFSPNTSSPRTGSDKRFPPVSFPSAKRYVFKGYGDPVAPRARTTSESGSRPGSIFSVEESIAPRSKYGDRIPSASSSTRLNKRAPSAFNESSWGRSTNGRNSPTINSNLRFTNINGDRNQQNRSPDNHRWGAKTPEPIEPAFDKPLPYVIGRAPILRVFIPLSNEVPAWPCVEGALRARKELERCGAWGKLRIGDIIVNTALTEPLLSRHLMIYIPTMQPFLCPLEYRYSEHGHLPGYLDAFTIPPSFYYPLLFSGPYVIHLDLAPWADAAADTLRLAFARSDITTTRGDKVTAKRYLHVVGFQITAQTKHQAVDDWFGMVSIESEGTAEGRKELLRRLGRTPDGGKIPSHKGPFEVVREKSLGGSMWLRLVSETTSQPRRL